MRKYLVLLLAAGFMVGLMSPGKAQTVVFTAVPGDPTTPPGTTAWSAGVDSDTARFTNVLTGVPATTTFPKESQVVYGQNVTFDNSLTAPAPDQTDPITAKGVYLDYTISVDGCPSPAQYFRVVGDMSGSFTASTTSGGNSLAAWSPSAFFTGASPATLAPVAFVVTVDPITGHPSDEITVSICGFKTDIFIDAKNPLTAPLEPGFSAPTPASVNGFIRTTSVPESGALGLLLTGLAGALGGRRLFRRRA